MIKRPGSVIALTSAFLFFACIGLNISIITTGLTLNPFGNIPAAGTTVMVVGRDVTQ